MKRLKDLLFISCIFIIFMSCGKKQQPETVVLNDILQLQQAQINSFDPVDAYHAGHIHMVKQIYNTLADIDLKGNTVPSLAKSWKTSDGITWIFHLRDDVLFSADSCFNNESDRQFKAIDVIYTFERMLNKDSKSLGVSYFKNIVGFDKLRNGQSNTLEGLKIRDESTIVFQLKKADYNFPNLLTLPYTGIVKRKAVDFYGDNFKLHPVGSGPFQLASFESNQKVSFIKNPSYWESQDGKHLPFVDEITISLTTDDNLSLLMFKNQKSDFLELNLPLQRQLENMNFPFDYQKESLEWTQLNFYLFNLERITDKNIRQGINFAIDREGLQNIIGDQGAVTKSLFPAIFSDLTTPNSILTYSPDKAENMLSKKMSLNLVCFEDILSRAIADYLSKQLKAYDVDVKIEAVTFPVLIDRLTSGNYDIIQLYWGPLYADVRHFLNPFITASFPPAGNNFNKYSNPNFDGLVETAPQLPSAKQIDQYLNAQRIILNDMPFFLAYYKNMIRVSNKKFAMPIHPLGYRFYKYAKLN